MYVGVNFPTMMTQMCSTPICCLHNYLVFIIYIYSLMQGTQGHVDSAQPESADVSIAVLIKHNSFYVITAHLRFSEKIYFLKQNSLN